MNKAPITPPPPGPDGLNWRPMTRADLAQLVDLARSCFLADGGLHFMVEPEEILNRFFPEDPGAAIGLWNADGQLVAGSTVTVHEGSGKLRATIVGYVRLDMRGRGVGTSLLRWNQVQAESLLAGAVADQRVLLIRTESLTEAASRLYQAHGFTQEFEELVMRRDLNMPLPEHAFPPDVTIASWRPELADQFFQVYDAAFRERPGFPGLSAAEWIDDWTNDNDHFKPDWSLLARTGDVPLAFLTGSVNPPHGFVMQVGVIPTQRRRGLASGLVVEAMRRMQAAGAVSSQLTVNVNNPGAIQTYVEIGFATIGRRARYERILEG